MRLVCPRSHRTLKLSSVSLSIGAFRASHTAPLAGSFEASAMPFRPVTAHGGHSRNTCDGEGCWSSSSGGPSSSDCWLLRFLCGSRKRLSFFADWRRIGKTSATFLE